MSAVKTTLQTLEREIAALPQNEQTEVRRQVVMALIERIQPSCERAIPYQALVSGRIEIERETVDFVQRRLLEMIGVQIQFDGRCDIASRTNFIRGRIVPID